MDRGGVRAGGRGVWVGGGGFESSMVSEIMRAVKIKCLVVEHLNGI